MPENNFINSILGTGDDEMEAIQKQDKLIKEYKKPSENLQIYIPTFGRLDKQITLDSIPDNLLSQTWLVVRPCEYESFKEKNYTCNILKLSNEVNNFMCTRREIIQHATNSCFIMLDDDLVFFRRISCSDWKLRKIEDQELSELFYEIEQQLIKGNPYVGVASREGFNHLPMNLNLVRGKRMTRIHAFNMPRLLELNATPDSDFEALEDFEVQLRFITEYKITPIMLLDWAHNQSGSNSTGGCSTYRTMLHQEHWAKQLAAKYPDFVKLVKKKTKTAWNGQERTDVVISWQKAYNQHF